MVEGREQRPLEPGPEADAIAAQLIGKLETLRGDLDPAKPYDPQPIATPEVFEQLRALGYIQD